MSIIFDWEKDEMNALLKSCENDDCLSFISKYINGNSIILESGCGLCRWVKYLNDKNYHIIGLEFSGNTLKQVKDQWPELNILQGDAKRYPLKDNSFDIILSFGVVEHFPEGPIDPLSEIYRILKPNGIAIISVPCLNSIRRFKNLIWYDEIKYLNMYIYKLIKNKKISINRLQNDYKYTVYPAYGDFFEYRFTPGEFEEEILKSGLKIIKHLPSDTMDGLYHELNPLKLLVKYENWEFKPTKISRVINDALSRYPFMHCHMQVIIATKNNLDI